MFGFKKKQPAPVAVKAIPAKDSRLYQEHWPWLRQFLIDNLTGAVAIPGEDNQEIVELPEFGLQFWADFYQHDQLLQLVIQCRRQDFTDNMEEILVAAGQTVEEQRQELAVQLKGLVLGPLLDAINEQNGSWHNLCLQGREHRFYACESAVMGRCKDQAAFAEIVPQGSLWQRFKDEIIPYLGCKKNYWLKFYQSNFGGEPGCELRINDRLVPELSELLTHNIQKYELADWDQKQTVMLWQDAATCLDYPFSSSEVRQYALQALRLFAAGQSSDEVYQKIWAQSGDVSLACDLAHLLPEICCFKCVREADTPNKTFILRSAAWPDDLQLRESQFGCYDWLEQAINEYFSTDKPSRETLGRIIGCGAMAKAQAEAIKKGSQMKNLRYTMLFWVPGDYILR